MRHIGPFWREVVLGIFFVDGLFAALQIDPLGSIFHTLDNATIQLSQSLGTPVANTYQLYFIASIAVEIIGAIIGLLVAGIFGLIAIGFAYASGFLVLHHLIIGAFLFFVSTALLFTGHHNKKEKERKAKEGKRILNPY